MIVFRKERHPIQIVHISSDRLDMPMFLSADTGSHAGFRDTSGEARPMSTPFTGHKFDYHKHAIALLAVILMLGALAADSLHAPSFWMDDAYITQHNALALLGDAGRQFPQATPLHGATSLVHLALVTAVGALVPVDWGQWWLGILAAALFAMGILRIAWRAPLSWQWAWLLVGLALLLGETPRNLLNGLETGLAMAASTWTIGLTLERGRLRRLLHILLGLLPFVRPELALLSGIVGFVEVAHAKRAGLSWLGAASRVLIPAAVAAAPFAIASLLAVGTVWPATVAAKEAFYADGCGAIASRLPAAIQNTLQAISLLGLAVAGLAGTLAALPGWLGLAFSASVLSLYVWFPDGMRVNEFRYLYPCFPAVIVGLALGMSIQQRSPRALFKSIALMAFATTSTDWISTWHEEQARIADSHEEFTGIAEALNTLTSDDSVVLVHDVGYLGLHANAKLVDLVGLKSPQNVALHQELTLTSCGARRGEAVSRIAEFAQAQFLVAGPWTRKHDFVGWLRDGGWIVERADPERGEARYKIYHLSRSD